MKSHLSEHIVTQLGRRPDHLDKVLDAFKPVTTKKNEVLVEYSTVCRKCFFIISGCLKVATCNDSGVESTIHLAFEQEWRTVIDSFLNQSPSQERIVAVESSQLMVIDRHDFNHLVDQVEGFKQVYQQLLEASYIQATLRVQALMTLDARGRLEWLLKEQPLIFTRLSNRLIASYLGMSEATLSRLKAKL